MDLNLSTAGTPATQVRTQSVDMSDMQEKQKLSIVRQTNSMSTS